MILSYLLGFLRNFKNFSISKLTLIDKTSSFSSFTRVNRFVKIVNTSIGRYSYIGSGCFINNTQIGHFCSISWDCSIGLASHTMSYISTSPIFTERHNGTGYSWSSISIDNTPPLVIIGNDVWIGTKVIILSGVTIGDGAVIAAGSIVTKNVAPYSIVGGVPAKFIRFRFDEEIINNLLIIKWWDKPDSELKSKINLFQDKVESLKDLQKLI
jgi:acetyltransferase-like isoleucine patch superfamily enzyme